MNTLIQDADYLEMCYALAEKARGHTSPNPYVGAVIVRAGRVVGWGTMKRPGSRTRRSPPWSGRGGMPGEPRPILHWSHAFTGAVRLPVSTVSGSRA
jgi:hypothetical protein